MDEVLGTTAGNALEVRESVDHLTGAAREPRLHEVTVALAAAALVQARLRADEETARAAAQQALDDGGAAERFGRWSPRSAARATSSRTRRTCRSAACTRPVAPERPGYVTAVDARAVGLVVTGLGGNRRREDDQIDHGVGLTQVAPIGAEVGPDRPLAIVHARGDASADEAGGRAAGRGRTSAPRRRPSGRVLLGRRMTAAGRAARPPRGHGAARR